jgi:hypothetical protein
VSRLPSQGRFPRFLFGVFEIPNRRVFDAADTSKYVVWPFYAVREPTPRVGNNRFLVATFDTIDEAAAEARRLNASPALSTVATSDAPMATT